MCRLFVFQATKKPAPLMEQRSGQEVIERFNRYKAILFYTMRSEKSSLFSEKAVAAPTFAGAAFALSLSQKDD